MRFEEVGQWSDRISLRRLAPFVFFVSASAAIACWPMITNKQPFLLSDTTTYVRGADTAAAVAFGSETDWTQRYYERFNTARSGADAQQTRVLPAAQKPVIITGRSIYYGAVLYISDRLSSLRLAAIIQSILAVTCILLTITRFGRMSTLAGAKCLLPCTLLLSTCSSLAYFCCYLEPDLTSALAILAAGHLIVAKPALSWRATLFWSSVLSFCALMHASTILILLIIAIFAFVASATSRTVTRRGLSLLVCSAVVGLAGEALFEGVVLRHFGTPPIRPPFLMARLIADGPGRAFLQEHCPGVRFTLCSHLPSVSSYDSAASSDAFLWSPDPRNGVFSAVSPDERRRIAGEENRFVISVLKDRPLAVLKSSILSVAQQSTRWGLPEFNLTDLERTGFAQQLPPRVWQQQVDSLAFRRAMPVRLTEALTLPVALLSLAVILMAFGSPKGGSLRTFNAALLLGFVADVVICGALSTPHDRYLMRVAWLLPTGAIIAIIRLSRSRPIASASA